MSKSEGIADLSYQHYTGELGSHKRSWRVIAYSTATKAMKNKWFWIITCLTGWFYLFNIAFLYIIQQSMSAAAAGGAGGGMSAFGQQLTKSMIWKDQFLFSLQTNQMLYMIIALIVGAGSIANDSRSNALLVYLSKPCTKTDYLIGKWVGVFIPIFLSMAVPSYFFYLYGATNYREYGFLSDDYFMILKVTFAMIVGTSFYTSLIIGFSSIVKRPALASAILGGLYILTYFFQKLMQILSMIKGGSSAMIGFAEQASYFSVNGLVSGITKVILATNGSPVFGGSTRTGPPIIPRPDMFLSWAMVGGVIFLGIWVAWTRIRAVEVVQ